MKFSFIAKHHFGWRDGDTSEAFNARIEARRFAQFGKPTALAVAAMADTLAVGSDEVRQADQKIPDRGQVGNKSTVKSALGAPRLAVRGTTSLGR